MLKQINPYPTLKELSAQSGVKFQTLNKIEKGLFTNLPNEVAKAICASSTNNYSPVELQALYQSHRKNLLKDTLNKIESGEITAEAFFTHASEIHKHYHSWEEFRKSLHESQMGFCEMFVFHQAILQKYEAGKMASFPVGLTEVLTEFIEAIQGKGPNSVEWILAVKGLKREVLR